MVLDHHLPAHAANDEVRAAKHNARDGDAPDKGHATQEISHMH